MVEINNEDLFNSVIKGKKVIEIDDKKFEIDLSVEDSLAILQFYTNLYKVSVTENEVSKKIIANVRKVLMDVFKKSYVGLSEETINKFIESRFLDIVSAIAVSCGWVKKVKDKEEDGVTLGE